MKNLLLITLLLLVCINITSGCIDRESQKMKAAQQNKIGRDYLEKDDFENAIIAFKKTLTKYPNQTESNARAELFTGYSYIGMGEYQKALEALNTTLYKYSNSRSVSVYTKFLRAITYHLMGQYENAIEEYSYILQEHRQLLDKNILAKTEVLFGIAYKETGSDKFSKNIWKEAAGKNPEEAFSKAASFLLGESIDFEKSFATEKFKNDYLYLIGFKYQMQGKPDQAKTYYQKCQNECKGYMKRFAIESLNKLMSDTR